MKNDSSVNGLSKQLETFRLGPDLQMNNNVKFGAYLFYKCSTQNSDFQKNYI